MTSAEWPRAVGLASVTTGRFPALIGHVLSIVVVELQSPDVELGQNQRNIQDAKSRAPSAHAQS